METKKIKNRPPITHVHLRDVLQLHKEVIAQRKSTPEKFKGVVRDGFEKMMARLCRLLARQEEVPRTNVWKLSEDTVLNAAALNVFVSLEMFLEEHQIIVSDKTSIAAAA